MQLSNPNSQAFFSLAQLALAQFPLRGAALHFLGHSDNLTFRVDEAAGASYLLRLHYPVLHYWNGDRQNPEFIASELAWLEALAAEGTFNVQRPVRTRAGQLVALIPAASLPENSPAGEEEFIPATLLTWLEGTHFAPLSPGAVDQVICFGELVARLHDFSARWAPPPGFIRPWYDLDHFRRIFARLMHGVDLGVFSEETFWTLRAVSQAILQEIARLPFDPQHWGVIHADLHVGNFLVKAWPEENCQRALVPIDFSFCGFGHYLFDLSVCLSGGLNATLRPAFLQGYRAIRPLAELDLRPIDAYALAGMFSYYAYQIDNPSERAWLQRRIPELVNHECRSFLQGQPVLLTQAGG